MAHIKPRPGVWPVNPERLEEREEWVARYEALAAGYASCRHVADLGDGPTDRDADAVRALHDDACRVHSELPLA